MQQREWEGWCKWVRSPAVPATRPASLPAAFFALCGGALLISLPAGLQLELYRDTRESIVLATQQPHCLRDMSPAAKERAFRREMQAERNLHPALQAADGHYKVCGTRRCK